MKVSPGERQGLHVGRPHRSGAGVWLLRLWSLLLAYSCDPGKHHFSGSKLETWVVSNSALESHEIDFMRSNSIVPVKALIVKFPSTEKQ